MIQHMVIALSLEQYLFTDTSQSLLLYLSFISHLNNIVSLCEFIVNTWENCVISLLNVVCDTYKLHGWYSETGIVVGAHKLYLLKHNALVY
jgi:hypothetical protein